MKANSDVAPWHYDMNELGFNYRLTDIACALGLSQLKKFDSFLEKRRKLAKRYDEVFKDIDGINPLYSFYENSAYHLYIVRIDFYKSKVGKKELFEKLREKKIFLQFHYIPINKQPYYKNLGYGEEKTPNMDKYCEEAVSLPLFPKLTFGEQEYVVKSLLEVLDV